MFHQRKENEVKHWAVRLKVPGVGTVHMGYYAGNKNEAREYALADFPNGKVTNIKQK